MMISIQKWNHQLEEDDKRRNKTFSKGVQFASLDNFLIASLFLPSSPSVSIMSEKEISTKIRFDVVWLIYARTQQNRICLKGASRFFFSRIIGTIFFFYGCMSLIDHVFSLKIILMVGGS